MPTKLITGIITNETETVPESTAATATITATSGGSAFTLSTDSDEFRRLDWIVDKANGEVYKIDELKGNVGRIVGNFLNTLSGAAISKIRDIETRNQSVSLTITGTTVQVNGTVVGAGSKNYSAAEPDQAVGIKLLEPIVVVAGASDSVQYDILKF